MDETVRAVSASGAQDQRSLNPFETDKERPIVKYNRAQDIVFKLKPREGLQLNTSGIVDRRLFLGGNSLHAKMNKQTCLWRCEYEMGELPPQLKGQFTSFNKIYDAIRVYFDKRNIDIIETIDAEDPTISR